MAAVQMDLKHFQESVSNGEKPVLVEFWAPWCVYCRRIGPAFQKVAEQHADDLLVGQVNIDEAPEAAQQYQVEVVPTLMLFRNGKVLGSLVAPDSKAKIEEFLEEQLRA